MIQDSKRILLIEDSATEGAVVQSALERSSLSCQIDWVRTLGQGLERLRDMEYHAVLSDLLLPDSEGLDTVRRLRLENQEVPIIVMTGMPDRVLEVTVIEQGATDYLWKTDATPFRLTRTLERAIEGAALRNKAEFAIRSLTEELRTKTALIDRQQELLTKKNLRLQSLYQSAHRFVDSLSSELHTPLAVIKDYLSLVRDELVGPVNDEQRRMLDIASVRADDLNNMIDDLRDISKVESGTVSAWRRRCHLDDALRHVCPTIQRKAAIKDVLVELDYAGEFPDLYCDAEIIGRALMNLAVTALRAQGSAGKLRIWARPNLAEGQILIGVEELSGRVVPAELNSMFQQLDESQIEFSTGNRASELGQGIAKELVSLNYGTMHVAYEPGVKSNLWFSVPIYEPLQFFLRYLHHETLRQPDLTLSILECGIPAGLNEAEAGDLDCFFQCLLRRHDIVFRVHENKWVLVLPLPPDELPLFLKRMASEFEIASSRLCQSELPSFTVHTLGSWKMPVEREQALAAFLAAFGDPPESERTDQSGVVDNVTATT